MTRTTGKKRNVPLNATPWHEFKEQMNRFKRKNSSSDDEQTEIEEETQIQIQTNSNLDKTAIILENGKSVKTAFFQGYRVTEEDLEMLETLRNKLQEQGKSYLEINATLKVARKKCEKKVQRLKAKQCDLCERVGHVTVNCPTVRSSSELPLDKFCSVCSTVGNPVFECKLHVDKDAKFCLICDSVGHIASTCAVNPKNKYPPGGSCRLCGDVTHVVKRCPTIVKKKKIVLPVLTPTQSIDALDYAVVKEVIVEKKKPYKIVKF